MEIKPLGQPGQYVRFPFTSLPLPFCTENELSLEAIGGEEEGASTVAPGKAAPAPQNRHESSLAWVFLPCLLCLVWVEL